MLEAANQTPASRSSSQPARRFFVLRDDVALRAGTSPTRRRRPSRPRAGSHVRLQPGGRTRVPERDRADRAARPGRQHVRSVTEPAFRGRARQPATHGPVDQLQELSRTGSPAATAPTSPPASADSRPKTWQPSFMPAPCRCSSASSADDNDMRGDPSQQFAIGSICFRGHLQTLCAAPRERDVTTRLPNASAPRHTVTNMDKKT